MTGGTSAVGACFVAMVTNTKKTPAWLIERAAQGELDEAELHELRARLADEGRSLDEELSRLRQSNQQILARLPKEEMGAAIRRRAAGEAAGARARWYRLYAPLALAGTVGLLVLGVRGMDGQGVPASGESQAKEVITTKGDESRAARLVIYRQRTGQTAESERLGDGVRGLRGDLLQLAYEKAPEGVYGVMVSVDGAGKTTVHLPDDGSAHALPLQANREFRLPSAYELDDAPGFERFILVTAPQPFSVASVVEATDAVAQRLESARTQSLSLPKGFFQTSSILNKSRQGTP